MEMHDYTLHARALNRDFDAVVYGDKGPVVLAFPEGTTQCTSWENAGMIDILVPMIEQGQLRLVCVESMDGSTWHGTQLDDTYRLNNLRGYFDFVGQELLEFLHSLTGEKSAPFVIGAGTGATNAALAFARAPQNYAGLLAMGGSYDVRFAQVDNLTDEWLEFSTVDVVSGLVSQDAAPADKNTALADYANKPLAFVSGQAQGQWVLESYAKLKQLMAELGVEATFELWGADVDQDWYWYKEQLRQLLPGLLLPGGLVERRLVAKVEAASAECDHVTVRLERTKVELESATSGLDEAKVALEAAQARVAQEKSEVEKYAAEEERLGEAASIAWAERDRIETLLEEATITAEQAQSQVDEAAERRAAAEWICGEAQAALAGAAEGYKDAMALVTEAGDAVRAAEEVAKTAQERLAAAQAERESEHARLLEQAAQKKQTPVKKPAAKATAKKAPTSKAAAKSAAKPAVKATAKPATKAAVKPATTTKPATTKTAPAKSTATTTTKVSKTTQKATAKTKAEPKADPKAAPKADSKAAPIAKATKLK